MKFTILHFNDFHARVEPDDEYHGFCHTWSQQQGKCHGGIARMKTVIDQERQKGLPLLVLNAGDDFVGTLWDYHFKGNATATFMKQLNITAMTLGNHDLDYGPDIFVEYAKQLGYPVLSANFNPNGHTIKDYVKPYMITDVEGHKVGICGITTESTNDNANPYPGWVDDHYSKGEECVKKLKDEEGVKIIIMLSHEGYSADKAIAKSLYGLDLVIGGHSHAFLANGEPPALSWNQGNPNRDHVWGEYPTRIWSDVSHREVPVAQAGWAGRYLGRLTVEFDDDGNLLSIDGAPILLGDEASSNPVPMDPEMKRQIEEWRFW